MLKQEQFRALVEDDQRILARKKDAASGAVPAAIQRSLETLVSVQARATEPDGRIRAERR